MAKRRSRWEEELERQSGHPARSNFAELDTAQRAGVLAELQRAGGNRALQQVVEGPNLQREAAPKPVPVAEDTRVFMEVAGIAGPSVDPKHKGLFEVEDYQLEMKTPTDPSTGGTVGVRQYSNVSVIVKKSGRTPAFRAALVRNQPITTVRFTGIERTTLTDVQVVGVKDLPNGRVQLTFSFRHIEWETEEESFEDVGREAPERR